jgi:DNA-binding winged helix-turn-helix (wHTH) protein/mannose-6-phosphate isomerase-like protein (cupin superfamily)
MPLPPRSFAFETFTFKVPTRELLRVGDDGSATPIPLGLRAADLLLLFLERPSELVTKAQIMDAVWPGTVVEESNLSVQIAAIRRALDADRNGDSCILSVPRRGYRFTLDVKEEDQPQSEMAVGASAVPKEAAAPVGPVPLQSPPAAGRTKAADKPLRYWRLYAAVVIAILIAAASVVAIVGRPSVPPLRAAPPRGVAAATVTAGPRPMVLMEPARISPAMLHEKDVELIVVLEGTGNIVTGGKLVDENRMSANHVSGSSIASGNSQAVVKGDMLIVPANTPHQVIPTGGAPIVFIARLMVEGGTLMIDGMNGGRRVLVPEPEHGEMVDVGSIKIPTVGRYNPQTRQWDWSYSVPGAAGQAGAPGTHKPQPVNPHD